MLRGKARGAWSGSCSYPIREFESNPTQQPAWRANTRGSTSTPAPPSLNPCTPLCPQDSLARLKALQQQTEQQQAAKKARKAPAGALGSIAASLLGIGKEGAAGSEAAAAPAEGGEKRKRKARDASAEPEAEQQQQQQQQQGGEEMEMEQEERQHGGAGAGPGPGSEGGEEEGAGGAGGGVVVEGADPFAGLSAKQRKLMELRQRLQVCRKQNQGAVIAEKKRQKVRSRGGDSPWKVRGEAGVCWGRGVVREAAGMSGAVPAAGAAEAQMRYHAWLVLSPSAPCICNPDCVMLCHTRGRPHSPMPHAEPRRGGGSGRQRQRAAAVARGEAAQEG